jgi:tripartite-type tricarboxylate transporter receptor subunit TctC
MDPTVMKVLHDAFKKAMEDPRNLELLEQLNQQPWYRSGDDYRKWAAEAFSHEKALIGRLGLALK